MQSVRERVAQMEGRGGSGRKERASVPGRISRNAYEIRRLDEAPPPPQRPPAVPPGPAPQPACYALADEEYEAWKRAAEACRKATDPLEPLRALATTSPKLLNWRNPVTGQTLLHEVALRGGSQSTLEGAEQLGCQRAMTNARGETADALARRKAGYPGEQRTRWASATAMPQERQEQRSRAAPPRQTGALRSEEAKAMPRERQEQRSRAAPPRQTGALRSEEAQPFAAAASDPEPRSGGGVRKKGTPLATMETASVPQAKMDLELDLNEEKELDREQLQASLAKAYGGKARVLIDECADRSARENRDRGREGRWQNVKCRVVFDSREDARAWERRSACGRAVQEGLAAELNIGGGAVELEGAAKVNEVDAVTLKLDSDSSAILCGACLLYNGAQECEKVVHYSDLDFHGGAVRHSGDTRVDGKSVHTISVVLSKVPEEITQLYFSLCSCGPEDLSGFKNPSIILYENSQPDANLLEYSINQAAKSVSSVMARMIRQQRWKPLDRVLIARVLWKLKMPLLCVDLCTAMGEESAWSIQALGTKDWNLKEKICGNYQPSQDLIQARLKAKVPVSAPSVSVLGGRGGTGTSAGSSSSGGPAAAGPPPAAA